MLYFLASLSYSISILIDVFVWYLRYYFKEKSNLMYIMSLITIFQFIARGFVLVFNPIMSYLTDKLQNISDIWIATMTSHILVVVLLLLVFNEKLSKKISYYIIYILSKKTEKIDFEIGSNKKWFQLLTEKKKSEKVKYSLFLFFTTLASVLYAVGISFLYFLSFAFRDEVLLLNSFSQIVNMFGTMILLLYIDPTLYKAFDNKNGSIEVNLYAIARILAHVCIIIILLLIRP